MIGRVSLFSFLRREEAHSKPLTEAQQYSIREGLALHPLLRLTLVAALLVAAGSARGALDRCMTSFEEEVYLLVNEQRAQGTVCGDTAYAPASDLEAEQMLHNSAKRHSEDIMSPVYSQIGVGQEILALLPLLHLLAARRRLSFISTH